eukprot:TRINITY_DN17543_c0_g2_i1.p1 TRINITY_DN17543_c0_g2~~TRINITY_DN17543_c0_g2_i1.p1  ORF type:complete len:628 (+),score=129.23 TRINITY_DN17543_c0_g2_i1:141-2024(+)
MSRFREEEIVYPEPKIKWHVAAEDHPSIFNYVRPKGLQKPLSPTSAATTLQAAAVNQKSAAIQSSRAGGKTAPDDSLCVCVEAAERLAAAAASYFVTAYYPGESEDARAARRTRPQKATPSAANERFEECKIWNMITVPFNSRQQFVKVALYRVELQGDALVGEATVPIADERCSQVGLWPVTLDFEVAGQLKFSVALPGDPLPLSFCEPAGAPATDATSTSIKSADGILTVAVESLSGLHPSCGSGSYYVSASYPGEPEDVVTARRTKPVRAIASRTGADKEDCDISSYLELPFNSRQQFVKVFVYRADQRGDSLVGEATGPVADERICSLSSWSLTHDFEHQGSIVFSAHMPGEDLAPLSTSTTAVSSSVGGPKSMKSQSSDAPSSAASPVQAGDAAAVGVAASRLCNGAAFPRQSGPDMQQLLEGVNAGGVPLFACKAGDRLEVFSQSAQTWLVAVVAQVDGTIITVDYADRRRHVDLASPDAGVIVRAGVHSLGSRPELLSAALQGPQRTKPASGYAQDAQGAATSAVVGPRSSAQAVPAAAAVAAQEASAAVALPFAQGERVQVWSASRRSWLDGTILEAYVRRTTTEEGYCVDPGTVMVVFGGNRKWILPHQVHDLLRKLT